MDLLGGETRIVAAGEIVDMIAIEGMIGEGQVDTTVVDVGMVGSFDFARRWGGHIEGNGAWTTWMKWSSCRITKS